jgi:hypothetical protein
MSEDGVSEAREARGHFSGGEKSNKESAIGKQEFSESRLSAEERVRTGEDTEGSFLFKSLKEKFSESPDISRFGAVANTYKDAKDALGKIEDPAELEKAIISLRSFHESVGLGKYLVNIEADANTTPEQRREFIKQKVAEDVAKMPEQFAIHEMSDYLDHRARTDHLQNKLKSSLPMGEIYGKGIDPVKIPPRQHARIDAYDMQGEADRAYWSGQRLVDRISDDRVSREFHDIRSQRLSLTEESAVPLAEREEEEREKMVGERIVSLRQQIEESRGKKYAETFDNLPENEKKYLASCLIDDEEEIRVAGKNFETALKSEDADRIVGTVSKSKEARVKLKESLGRVDVALAEQLSKNASSRLIKIRKEIASGGGRQHWLSKEEVNKGLSAVKEKISSFVGKNVAKLKAEIAPVLDKVMQKAESVDDALFRGVIWVGEKFDATVGRAAKAVKDKLSEIRRNISDVMKRISSGIERKKLSLRKNYYDKRHAINVAKDRAMSNLGIANLEAKHKAALRVRKIIGGSALSEEEKKEFDKKKERISEAVERLKGIKTKEHDKTSENNPHYEHFWKEIDYYVKHINKPPDTDTSQATKANKEPTDTNQVEPADTIDTNHATESKELAKKQDKSDQQRDSDVLDKEKTGSTALNTEVKSEFRPHLTDYEVFGYEDKSGKHNILVWTDGEEVKAEEVDERGTFMKAFTKYELKKGEDGRLVEDPREVIKRSIDDLISKYEKLREAYPEPPTTYERGLYFKKDEDGIIRIEKQPNDEAGAGGYEANKGEADIKNPDESWKRVWDFRKEKDEAREVYNKDKTSENQKKYEDAVGRWQEALKSNNDALNGQLQRSDENNLNTQLSYDTFMKIDQQLAEIYSELKEAQNEGKGVVEQAKIIKRYENKLISKKYWLNILKRNRSK